MMMRKVHWEMVGALLCLLLVMAAVPTTAQGGNLLRNGGFESTLYVGVTADPQAGVYYNAPAEWQAIVVQPGPEPWRNAMPNGFPHDAAFVREGERSFAVGRGGGTFTSILYQGVYVQPGSPLNASVWAYAESGQSQVRIGIDPTGGFDPSAPSVVWSDWSFKLREWTQVSVSTTAVNGVAVVFLFATQTDPSNPNNVYWDDAVLTGAAGSGEQVFAPEEALSPEEAPAPAVTNATYTARNNVRLRGGPSQDFPTLATVPYEAVLPVLGRSTDSAWIQVTYGGQTGWVSATFGNLSAPASTLPVTG